MVTLAGVKDRRRRAVSRAQLLAEEQGAIRREAELRIALTYPSPYKAAMSSLGYQHIYRLLNEMPGIAADRAMLPDPSEPGPPITLERGTPLGDYPVIAFSVAYELEIAGVVECLDRAGIPARADQRDHRHPLIIAGGPLTFSNPAPLAPICDLIALGEGEPLLLPLVGAVLRFGGDRAGVCGALAGTRGFYVPAHDGSRVPPVAAADEESLPARSVVLTPHTELANMFLVEPARGCSRGCTYCVMRRSTNGGMRVVGPERVLATIPNNARRVGLVGAAVTDHPHIRQIVRGIVESGRDVGISSLRADRLDDELVSLLAQGGYRTLTVAADGASERMRRVIERSTQEKHLLAAAALAAKYRLKTYKIYMMLGVPQETDDDVDELVRFSADLSRLHPHIAFGLAPFVAKRNTPLDGAPFAGIDVVEHRLERLRCGLAARGVAGRVEVRPTSARWAWVEYMLAQADPHAGLAVIDAHRKGGSFAAYKRAFAEHNVVPTGARARVLSSNEIIALRRRSANSEGKLNA